MKFSIPAVTLLFALPLVACAAKPIPIAAISASVATPAPVDLTSAIRGTREEGLLGSTGCFVAGIDGKIIPQAPRVYETPIPITAGIHSILIGSSSNQYATLAARLDAEAEMRYVIGCERETNIPLYPNKIFVWIEKETTHEVVMSKRQIGGSDFEAEDYKEPQGAADTVAIIRSAAPEGDISPSNAFLIAVDGTYVVNSIENRIRSFKVKSGRRAFLLGAYATNAFTEYPILLDVEAGHTYVVDFVLDSGVVPGLTNQRFTVWVDDKTTGVRVIPAQRVKLKNVPHFTTIGRIYTPAK
ncbi:MAG: hypothetical protein ACOH12_05605 [Parvibaculaceae bacterium]